MEGAVEEVTEGIGVDAVIVTAATESNDPTELAGSICRDRGIVSMVGAVKMDVPRKVYYEKELQLRLSRSYGPGRYDTTYEEEGYDYPIGYVRWTERRNMGEFLRLVEQGHVAPARLTTHEFGIDEAHAAYELVGGSGSEPFLGVLLKYPQRSEANEARTVVLPERPALPDGIGLGVIGAGNFARSVLLPRLQRSKDVSLVGVAASTGLSARNTGDRFGFRYCTTEASEVLQDEQVHAVVVATRYGSHAQYAESALRAGKAVFVERPLALNEEGLRDVLTAQAETGQLLTVGFNRRFSPLATQLKAAFKQDGPLAITYRINVGSIPGDSWIHDPEQGGGRIIGEVCHFVDFVSFLTEEQPLEVFVHSAGGAAGRLNDTVSITTRWDGGSIATIGYFANGDSSFPKERIEVFGSGAVAVLDDLRKLTVSTDGNTERVRRWTQQKGFDQEEPSSTPSAWLVNPIASLGATTRATFAIEESLHTGTPVVVKKS